MSMSTDTICENCGETVHTAHQHWDLSKRDWGCIMPDAETNKKSEVSVLIEAEHIINGSRQNAYGNSFPDIARLWTVYLDNRDWPALIGPQDVAMMLILMKVARATKGMNNTGQPQRDSLIDIAGYAGCSEQLLNEALSVYSNQLQAVEDDPF